MSYDYIAKIILVGKHNAGKTSLLGRLADSHRPLATEATIGVDFGAVTLMDDKKRWVRLHVWDTAGQDQFQSIVTAYYRQVCGAVVVVDVGDRDSLVTAGHYLEKIRKFSPAEIPVVLLGNKTDLPNRLVSDDDLARFCQGHGNIPWVLGSVKESRDVDAPFRMLINQIGQTFVDQDKTCPGLRNHAADKAMRLTSFPDRGTLSETHRRDKCCRTS